MNKFALAIALALASLGAQAQTWVPVEDAANKPLRFVAGAGLTYGGETIVTAQYVDGDEIDIDAGGSAGI